MSKKNPNSSRSNNSARPSPAIPQKQAREGVMGELRPVAEHNPLDRIASEFVPGTTPITGRRTVTHTEQFNGPIPHPDIFRKYGDVIPDAPERILRVFEEDSRHVREISKAALDAQREDNKRIHWMAYSLIAGGYAMAAFFTYLDKEVLAGIVLSTTIVGTVAGFLQQRGSTKASGEKSTDKADDA